MHENEPILKRIELRNEKQWFVVHIYLWSCLVCSCCGLHHALVWRRNGDPCAHLEVMHSDWSLSYRSVSLSPFQVKAIYIHSDMFSVQNGLLTPTLKAKRPELRDYFKKQIEELYSSISIWNHGTNLPSDGLCSNIRIMLKSTEPEWHSWSGWVSESYVWAFYCFRISPLTTISPFLLFFIRCWYQFYSMDTVGHHQELC